MARVSLNLNPRNQKTKLESEDGDASSEETSDREHGGNKRVEKEIESINQLSDWYSLLFARSYEPTTSRKRESM